MASAFLAIMTPDGWRPGIGDPTFMGWMTVCGYLLAFILCSRRFRVLLHMNDSFPRIKAKLLWSGLALILLALGVNKQLDLQTWLTAFGRALAREQGWYEQRRFVQIIFVIGITVILCGGLAMIAVHLPLASRRARVALIGVCFLTAFVVTRAASFHHFDVLLKTDLAGARLNWILELGGIFMIALAAGWKARMSVTAPAPAPAPSLTA